VCALSSAVFAQEPAHPQSENYASPSPLSRNHADKSLAVTAADSSGGHWFHPETVSSEGSIKIDGQTVDYHAVAGTLVVHPQGWNDSTEQEKHSEYDNKRSEEPNSDAEASIFYVAYFKLGEHSADRPITFIYNGGPGSSTVWLHMGAFGPRRVVTLDNSHTPTAPYTVVDNAYSLLDVSDMVFIDAPGTGFSRIAGNDAHQAFYGVDADAYAFTRFITDFLSKYGRWNSPKYLFGESYGTLRSAVVVNELELSNDVDFNGVIMLSQVLNADLAADTPALNPGTDETYILALPTYAAAAWYHNRVGNDRPAAIETYMREVEQFATTDYASALQAGSELSAARRQDVASRMAHYIGLPVAYLLKADLRIDAGQFAQMLQDSDGRTTGQLDARFSGPTMDLLSKEADYDPQRASIRSAYVSTFNAYVREVLGFGNGRTYRPEIDLSKDWNNDHQPPGQSSTVPSIQNVMPDLASAMKYNTKLKVMVNGGYYDLNTPFYEDWYECHHLQIPATLQDNIEFHYYESGHMVYAHEESLKQLHANVADFIRRTDNSKH
jgi:carboxypeptidase C (cathepsin A)